MTIVTLNPATGKQIAVYEEMSIPVITDKLERCRQASDEWINTPLAMRARLMHRLADSLLDNQQAHAIGITTEMGKPLASAMAEVEKCALVCRHFAEHARRYLAKRTVKTEFHKSYVAFAPLGIVLAIMPWNFPFWQVFRFAAPALMAGNGAILKHAPITTGCGLAIEQCFIEAGFPPSLFQTIVTGTDVVGSLISHPLISAVTLTGSSRAGKVVAAQAGAALKKCVLELGGSDPCLVLEDADPVQAVDAVLASRLNNAGQSCIAAKRILVVPAIRDAFLQALWSRLEAWKMGDPMRSDVKIGPLAREDLRTTLHRQVEASVRLGAELLRGGIMPEGPGFYYPVTVLGNVQKGMPAYEEELFGPVISLLTVKNETEALAIANDTSYGLAASIFTQNRHRGEKIAQNIQSGTVFINDFVRSDPRLPFGGIRQSGFGRELSQEGIREFTNIRTVVVR